MTDTKTWVIRGQNEASKEIFDVHHISATGPTEETAYLALRTQLEEERGIVFPVLEESVDLEKNTTKYQMNINGWKIVEIDERENIS